MCLLEGPELCGQLLSNVEFRLAKRAELLAFKLAEKRGVLSFLGGNGGAGEGKLSVILGGNDGGLFNCRTYSNKIIVVRIFNLY